MRRWKVLSAHFSTTTDAQNALHSRKKYCSIFAFASPTCFFPYLLLLLTFSPSTEQSISTFNRIVATQPFVCHGAKIDRSAKVVSFGGPPILAGACLTAHRYHYHDIITTWQQFFFSRCFSCLCPCDVRVNSKTNTRFSVAWVVSAVKCNSTGVVAKSHRLHKIRMLTDWEQQQRERGRDWERLGERGRVWLCHESI